MIERYAKREVLLLSAGDAYVLPLSSNLPSGSVIVAKYMDYGGPGWATIGPAAGDLLEETTSAITLSTKFDARVFMVQRVGFARGWWIVARF